MSSITPPHSIREARREEIPAIVALVNRAFYIEQQHFLEGVRTNAADVLAMRSKGVFFVMDNPPDGLLATIYVELRGEQAYFGMLAVEPEVQGLGLGQALIAHAEAFAREHGCRVMDLKVLSPRKELVPFYRNLGYRESGTEEFVSTRPLKPGIECHKILMRKPL